MNCNNLKANHNRAQIFGGDRFDRFAIPQALQAYHRRYCNIARALKFH